MLGWVSDGMGFAVSAELLRRGLDNTDLVDGLAERLSRALPGQVEVRSAGWAARRHVSSLVVDLGPGRFRIETERSRSVAWVDQMVRGVCIRSTEVTLDGWLDLLAASLTAEAQRSMEVRLALQERMQ